MDSNKYDHHIAGTKTLWMLRFRPAKKETPTKQTVEFLVPTPFNLNRWVVVSNPMNVRSIEALLRFEKICEEATERCRLQLEGKGVKINNTEADFPELIRYFQDFIKHFEQKPSKPKDPPLDLPDIE